MTLYQVVHHWALNDAEFKLLKRYLRGPKLCRDYDALPERVKAAVNDYQKGKQESQDPIEEAIDLLLVEEELETPTPSAPVESLWTKANRFADELKKGKCPEGVKFERIPGWVRRYAPVFTAKTEDGVVLNLYFNRSVNYSLSGRLRVPSKTQYLSDVRLELVRGEERVPGADVFHLSARGEGTNTDIKMEQWRVKTAERLAKTLGIEVSANDFHSS